MTLHRNDVAAPRRLPALRTYSTVTVARHDGEDRCSAQVVSCTVNDVELVCNRGQRFPEWFRAGVVFTLSPSARSAAYTARVHRCTATTASVDLLRVASATAATRRHTRVPVNNPARIVELPDALRTHVGVLRDVSVGGCLLGVATAIEAGTRVRITARVGHTVVEVEGTVVRAHVVDSVEHACGVALDRLPEPYHRAIAEFVLAHRGT